MILPDNVQRVGNNVFEYCSGLQRVTIGSGLKQLGLMMFYGCSALQRLRLGDSVNTIGESAFSGCSSLTNVTLDTGLTKIGLNAFDSCSSLPSITIPGTVADIGGGAFQNCTSLHQAFFLGNAPTINGKAGRRDSTVFAGESGTVYYLPGTTGWFSSYGGWPFAPWFQPNPLILGSSLMLDPPGNGFQFTISWATNGDVVVDASTDLLSWTPVATNTLVNGTAAFNDSSWTNYPNRFYRARMQ